MPVQVKKHTEYPLGFDRTQLFKEEIQPQINRTSAMSNVMELIRIHDLKPSMKEYSLLVQRFVQYIETGDTSFFELIDRHFKIKNELSEKKNNKIVGQLYIPVNETV